MLHGNCVHCLEICILLYLMIWDFLGVKCLVAWGNAAAPAGAVALETSSKVEAGAAMSLLCWGEPLCASSCLNILKLCVLAFWGDPSPLQTPELVFFQPLLSIKSCHGFKRSQIPVGLGDLPMENKMGVEESTWYNIFVWGTRCSSEVDTEICWVQPLSPSPHPTLNINRFFLDNDPEMVWGLCYALARLFMNLKPCSCWWGLELWGKC